MNLASKLNRKAPIASRFWTSCFPIVAGIAAVSGSPAAAQSGAEWRSTSQENACSLEYGLPADAPLFSISNLGSGAYSIKGTFLTLIEAHDGQLPTIIAAAPDHSVVLVEPSETVSRKTNQPDTLAEFYRFADGQDSFVLSADGVELNIALSGFSAALSEMQDCTRNLLPAATPRPPVLIAFNGNHQLAREASRQRMLSQKLGFTLTIDEQGNPTQCELSRDFRRRATEIALCRPLLNFMRFSPAMDENGNPTTGTYSSVIDFDMWMTQDGYLEAEDR